MNLYIWSMVCHGAYIEYSMNSGYMDIGIYGNGFICFIESCTNCDHISSSCSGCIKSHASDFTSSCWKKRRISSGCLCSWIRNRSRFDVLFRKIEGTEGSPKGGWARLEATHPPVAFRIEQIEIAVKEEWIIVMKCIVWLR